MKQAFINFVKKQTVLVVAIILAIFSMFLVHPSKEYASYIDWRVLGILLTLMIIMEGLASNGFFDAIGERLLSHTHRVWQLVLVLVFLCFFFAMLITNDVALITFVPFAIMMLEKSEKRQLIIPVVVMQTLAANLGSMLTPIGNPQNLYLYNISGLSIQEFVMIMLPYTVASAVLLLLRTLLLKGKSDRIEYTRNPDKKITGNQRRKITCYVMLFIFALLVVARVFPWWAVLIATILLTFTLDSKVLARVDYCLLFTFIAFFVFTGNLSNLPQISAWLERVVQGNELWTGAALSQFISNVPATLMLSRFSEDYATLLVGVNLGGLGTLIASMASLISYKLLAVHDPKSRPRYLAHFTAQNVLFFVVLVGCFFVLRNL